MKRENRKVLFQSRKLEIQEGEWVVTVLLYSIDFWEQRKMRNTQITNGLRLLINYRPETYVILSDLNVINKG